MRRTTLVARRERKPTILICATDKRASTDPFAVAAPVLAKEPKSRIERPHEPHSLLATTRRLHGLPRKGLGPHQLHLSGAGTDQNDSGLLTSCRQCRVLHAASMILSTRR